MTSDRLVVATGERTTQAYEYRQQEAALSGRAVATVSGQLPL